MNDKEFLEIKIKFAKLSWGAFIIISVCYFINYNFLDEPKNIKQANTYIGKHGCLDPDAILPRYCKKANAMIAKDWS